MCHVLTVTQGAALDRQAPDLPAEEFCSCGALLVSEEDLRWGACSACLDASIFRGYAVSVQMDTDPIPYALTARGLPPYFAEGAVVKRRKKDGTVETCWETQTEALAAESVRILNFRAVCVEENRHQPHCLLAPGKPVNGAYCLCVPEA